ncbi:MAG TPA: ferredoxin--NADP reductase [Puia sp.]|nr:ferredoxin--NADP reductase [Puia sp.]
MDRSELKVTNIVRETKDVLTFYLEDIEGKKISYEAGQFLTFIFTHGKEEIRRSYSFSSSPGIDNFASITVKRIVNGAISRFLTDHIRINDLLVSLPPSGRFTIETNKLWQRQIFFIAAGSGITPVFSLIKKILAEEPLTKIILIYQNHDEDNIIFKKELQELEKKYAARFKWISLLTRPRKHPNASHRLTNFLLEKLVKIHHESKKETLFYLCGPQALMRMAHFTLKLMGFADGQIKKENFIVEYIPPPPIIEDKSPKQIIIHFHQQEYHIKSVFPKTILQAALDNNIQLPYSCRGGRCSTCTARLLKGKVKMSINDVLTTKDLQEGLILTCVGYPETDIELGF